MGLGKEGLGLEPGFGLGLGFRSREGIVGGMTGWSHSELKTWGGTWRLGERGTARAAKVLPLVVLKKRLE